MSDPVKLAIVYYSSTGTGTEIANEIAAAAEKAGAEVRIRKAAELAPQSAIDSNPVWAAHHAATADIPAPTADDMEWADAVIFGSPTRFGNVAAQLKQFLDSLSPLWSQNKLADKVYSGFTSTATRHGGHESTLIALYNTIYHFGGIVVAPGYTDAVKFADGNPYGTSHFTAGGTDPVGDQTRNAARHQAERVVRIARALKDGSAA
ncbi:NAD(P)H dehydrogenase (quinone) [Asanoa ferruginea]|uniref:NAD(P)H dehydrogenase (Quinone) n=1 Tax=Asanoa ferruginea TaxID=53367 RepID=A0A3D9ZB99_9ACTN|nr:NAD(P)H:quinone oxidoreductase [Asanoa ferruginea]REF94696.1 NAD(P)H dehydrogenase (quinone) [Asanoa ferruginea]GIF45726.1 NAD(P)H:quinone oxidoreductase type IV [Asanoa ferruginea]